MPNTKHSCNGGFGPHFGRLDSSCPRCIELKMGDPPRKWDRIGTGAYPTDQEIIAHNCTRSNCGPVCTFGDW